MGWPSSIFHEYTIYYSTFTFGCALLLQCKLWASYLHSVATIAIFFWIWHLLPFVHRVATDDAHMCTGFILSQKTVPILVCYRCQDWAGTVHCTVHVLPSEFFSKRQEKKYMNRNKIMKSLSLKISTCWQIFSSTSIIYSSEKWNVKKKQSGNPFLKWCCCEMAVGCTAI